MPNSTSTTTSTENNGIIQRRPDRSFGETTIEERNRIVGRFQAGQSFNQIAKQTGVSCSSVSRLIARFQKTGSVENKPRKGRPPITGELERNALIEIGRSSNRQWNFEKVLKEYHDQGNVQISETNARRILRDAKIKLNRSRMGPEKGFKQKRLLTAQNQIDTIPSNLNDDQSTQPFQSNAVSQLLNPSVDSSSSSSYHQR